MQRRSFLRLSAFLLLASACAAETIETLTFTILTGNPDNVAIPGQMVFRLEPDGTAGTADIISASATAPPVRYLENTAGGSVFVAVPGVAYTKENFSLDFHPDPTGCPFSLPATDRCESLSVLFSVSPNQPYGNLIIEFDPFVRDIFVSVRYSPLPPEPSWRGTATYSPPPRTAQVLFRNPPRCPWYPVRACL